VPIALHDSVEIIKVIRIYYRKCDDNEFTISLIAAVNDTLGI
jgi:hypothetical protein